MSNITIVCINNATPKRIIYNDKDSRVVKKGEKFNISHYDYDYSINSVRIIFQNENGTTVGFYDRNNFMLLIDYRDKRINEILEDD